MTEPLSSRMFIVLVVAVAAVAIATIIGICRKTPKSHGPRCSSHHDQFRCLNVEGHEGNHFSIALVEWNADGGFASLKSPEQIKEELEKEQQAK